MNCYLKFTKFDVCDLFRFWFFKILAMIGLCIGVFFIEGESAAKFALGIIFVYIWLLYAIYVVSVHCGEHP